LNILSDLLQFLSRLLRDHSRLLLQSAAGFLRARLDLGVMIAEGNVAGGAR
jgi:hypothetical protein